MSLFHRQNLAFQPIDPLADGLGDDIVAEQQETEAIQLSEQLDITLAERWNEILEDVHKDPTWFSFSEDE